MVLSLQKGLSFDLTVQKKLSRTRLWFWSLLVTSKTEQGWLRTSFLVGAGVNLIKEFDVHLMEGTLDINIEWGMSNYTFI